MKEENLEVMGVFSIRNYFDKSGEERSEFTRSGVAFPRKKLKGYIVKLHSHNLNGDYLICPLKKKED